jgi:hypothetical protein
MLLFVDGIIKVLLLRSLLLKKIFVDDREFGEIYYKIKKKPWSYTFTAPIRLHGVVLS